MNALEKRAGTKNQKGFSLPELLIVVLIIAIVTVFALPQINSTRRAFRFSGIQRLIAASLGNARQEAMSQRLPITIRYADAEKKMIMHGGKFGTLGDVNNQTVELSGSGILSNELVYGRPGGAPAAALADTANLTPLAAGAAAITFQSDGSVIDAANNPQNNALFFYHSQYPNEMAFAISVLGAGGRVKVWRYNRNSNLYVE